ncbi:MAG: DUF29 domain-containing protein [Moorea sp. SIO4G2]|uniref:DUF29 domain-containing protein n=1 Tax=unclassified Moorena TaxID=2683338 RepID=UPI0013BCDBE2|nr:MULTISPECIES: DUF29 domain-containing protein [unclassified Moorena]NEO17285.1 DUF29 domain-containing protein [Moorena sp. SIO3E8]NEO65015.1 DUF29 domain-containing protein [Moorena sp. SIO4G2]NEQ03834.1 DUF29 domain-containing protein [Moorena sp. SIO3F7]NEQ79801.1 DUF29 domain-containing protein [Moorena sp. SIO2I5]
MKISTAPNTSRLYDHDYQLWLEATIKQLRSGDFTHVDWENLLDELESMAKKNKRAVKSLLTRLWEHLLKLKYWESERAYNANKWKAEITTFRQQIRDELLDSPSLKPYLSEIFANTYLDAKKVMGSLMDKPIAFFPEDPPASLAEVLKENWFFD